MAVKPFSKEELNFFKFSSIVLDEFPKVVRQIFVTLWDSKVAVLPGYQVWDDSTAVRNMLLKSEGGKTNIPTNQSIEEWDCTALFQATIYAKTFGSSSGKKLNDLYLRGKKPAAVPFHRSVNSPTANQDETYALAIDQIRLLRNTLCHSVKSEIAKADFDQFVQLAKDALTAAKVSTTSVDGIGGLTEDDFPTEKVNKLNKSFQKELQAMNQFLQGDMMETTSGIDERTREMMDKICEMSDKLMKQSEPTDTSSESSASDSLPKSHLPPLVPHFTGREKECEKISSLMTSKSTRFFNIWGSPGFGKTSTAIAVAHHLQSLGHPVYFFKYRGLRSKHEFISKLLGIFNSLQTSNANANLTAADKLCSIFREIPCRFFLVLDNLDDLLTCKPDDIPATSVKDEVVDLIQEILDSCPNVSLLTTTRENLESIGFRGEGYKSMRIDPLDQLSVNNLVGKFLPSASQDIRLQVTKISGNVPLAIRLLCPLIANESTETANQILVDVQSSENLLENLDNPYNTGNETLKKLFDSSFDRLLPNEKHALISLSVFPGTDIDCNAAAAVIGVDGVLACKRTLSILVNRSFIDEDPESKMYNLHPLLQSFVIEKGKSQFNKVALSAKTRFFNYYLRFFENLNEQFLTGKSLTAAFTFLQEKKNIYLSFYESLSHDEGLCDKVFDVLAKSEFFLLTLYVDDLDSVESLYNFVIKKAKEQNNDLAYCKLVVSKCFQNTLSIGNTFSELAQIRNKIASIYDGIEAKCLCYEGIHAASNGMVKSGVELMEKGISDLTKSYDQQILKCLILQLLALYHNFLKNLEKSEQFSQMALDQCKETSDPRLFLIGEYGTHTEKNKEENALRGLALENQPLILGYVCVLSIWAKEFLSDQMKSRWCNIVSELQSQLEVAAQSSGNVASLFHIGDLALFFLGTDPKKQIDETIQTIKNAIETEKHSVSLTKTGEGTLQKTERQKELEERLAQCYFRKAWCHGIKEEVSLALESFQKALDVRLELYGRQHPTIAQTYVEIGIKQNDMEDYSSAIESHQCALEIRKKLHGEQHETTANSYSDIGTTQHNMGDYTSALESQHRALDIRLNVHGEQHPATANSYSNIGAMQDNMGDYTSALESHRCALDIRLTLHGEIHESTANSYNAIANVQRKMGDSTSALKSFCSELDVRLKLHGEAHSTTANSYYSIGVVQYDIKDYAAALLSQYCARDIILKLGMEEHVEAANCYYLIGNTETELGDNESALESHRRALHVNLKLRGEQHETTADSYFQMGTIQFKMGYYTSALHSHQRALDIRLKLHGEYHSTTVDSYIQIGIMQNKLNDYAEALESNKKALKLSWILNGKLHATTADCYRYKAINLQKMGKRDLALENFQRERSIRSMISK